MKKIVSSFFLSLIFLGLLTVVYHQPVQAGVPLFLGPPVQISPKPQPPVSLPAKKQQGIVILSAFIINPNNRKLPLEGGMFSICGNPLNPGPVLMNQENFFPPDDGGPFPPPVCQIIITSKGGHAMIRLYPGFYTIGPAMKMMGVWKIEPASFWLPPAEVVRVMAILRIQN